MMEALYALRRLRPRVLSATLAAMLLLSACGAGDESVGVGKGSSPGNSDDSMGDMAADAPRVPPVFGYYGGQEISFIHTEASDADIASTLEGMMGSPVPVVESFAEIPEGARSKVYVSANGVVPEDAPAGPLGFAPDVFDTAPGDEEYTPLREVMLVTWSTEDDARVLISEQEVLDAEAAGELTVEDTGIVVNMPLLRWPGGQR
jgi:hypothetical protein